MDLSARLDFSSLLPNPLTRTVYLKLCVLYESAQIQGVPLQVSSTSLQEGHAGTAPINAAERNIRYAIQTLEALCLITREVGRDRQTVTITTLPADHLVELAVALQRLQHEKTGNQAYMQLRVTNPKARHLRALSQLLRGKTWGYELLTSSRFRGLQMVLPGMEEAVSGGSCGSGRRILQARRAR